MITNSAHSFLEGHAVKIRFAIVSDSSPPMIQILGPREKPAKQFKDCQLPHHVYWFKVSKTTEQWWKKTLEEPEGRKFLEEVLFEAFHRGVDCMSRGTDYEEDPVPDA